MTPFTVADLTVFNTGLDTLPNYLSKPYLILLGAGVVLAAVSLGLLFWKGPRNRRSGRQRLLAGLAAVLVSGGALAGSWALAFQLDQLSMVFSNLAFAYEDYGFSYCFFQTWLNRGIRRPAGYDAGEVARIRELIAKDAQEAEPQEDVNVVIVQLESFIDPKEIQGLVMSKDPVPNWTALKENYSSGYLTMPVVGAGTANSECEVLTGMSTRLFGPGEYPYQTCLMEVRMPASLKRPMMSVRNPLFSLVSQPWLLVIWLSASGTSVTCVGFTSSTRSTYLPMGFPSMLNSVVMTGRISLTS